MMQHYSEVLTTDASGNATFTVNEVFGWLARITIEHVDTDSGTDITIKSIASIKNPSTGLKETLEETLQTITNSNSDTSRAITIDTYKVGETSADATMLYPMAGENLQITVAQGGDSKKLRIRVIIS